MHTSDVIMAEARFIGKAKDRILANVDKFFWPALGRMGVRSHGGAIY